MLIIRIEIGNPSTPTYIHTHNKTQQQEGSSRGFCEIRNVADCPCCRSID